MLDQGFLVGVEIGGELDVEVDEEVTGLACFAVGHSFLRHSLNCTGATKQSKYAV